MALLWVMVRKDLLRQLRSPLAVSVALAFPLVFSGLLALTFGGGNSVPKVQLLVEDLDDKLLSGALVSALGSEQMAQHFDVRQVGSEGTAMMERGEASALLRIPEGFSENLIKGEPVTFELIRNPAQGILPEIAEQTLIVGTDLLDSASRMFREPLDELATFIDSGDDGPSSAQVAALAVSLHGIIEQAEEMLFPPVITLESVQLTAEQDDEEEDGGSTGARIFIFILPGISVWALFMLGDIAMRDILTESTRGTLRRQLSGPLVPGQIVLGKALYTAALATISLLILTTIGFFAVDEGIDLAAFTALSLALVLAVTGFSAVTYGIARNDRQGSTVASVLMLVFAFLGGSFFQIESMPETVRRFAPLSPFYWGTNGYRELIQSGGGLAEILPNIGVLSALGAVLLLLGGRLLHHKVRTGAA